MIQGVEPGRAPVAVRRDQRLNSERIRVADLVDIDLPVDPVPGLCDRRDDVRGLKPGDIEGLGGGGRRDHMVLRPRRDRGERRVAEAFSREFAVDFV